ncbi:hypothetical protein [Bacillus marinisedimentorum]|uniref:hypothetical protein n=1 Tax=Bacillus marinisedimentorum TaxID=1821260 RepID=UPI0014710900|nr:hypothetical protein [Bacillus marinisedimentorum]
MEQKGLDSCGSSGTGEIPQERSDEEAHRPPRGKEDTVSATGGKQEWMSHLCPW